MRLSLFVILFVAIYVPLFSEPGQSAQQSGRSKPSFTITISSAQKVIRAGSEVRVEFSLRNTSKRRLGFSRMGSGDHMVNISVHTGNDKDLTMKGRSGKSASNPGQILDLPVGGRSMFYIEPGESVMDEIILTDMFDLTVAGNYTIQLSRKDDISGTVVNSNMITLIVTP